MNNRFTDTAWAAKFSKLERLDALEQQWKDCVDCELSAYRSRVVHWRGSPDAPLLVLGEGPGADEDEQGRPFVGPAGRKLDELFVKAKVNPLLDVFVANLAGCRPPGNRAPNRDEMKACGPRLEAMIWIVQPRAILLLGATAARRLAGIPSITKWRGQETDVEIVLWNGHTVRLPAMPTFHPSYLLRSGDNLKIKKQMISDIRAAKRLSNVT